MEKTFKVGDLIVLCSNSSSIDFFIKENDLRTGDIVTVTHVNRGSKRIRTTHPRIPPNARPEERISERCPHFYMDPMAFELCNKGDLRYIIKPCDCSLGCEKCNYTGELTDIRIDNNNKEVKEL